MVAIATSVGIAERRLEQLGVIIFMIGSIASLNPTFIGEAMRFVMRTTC